MPEAAAQREIIVPRDMRVSRNAAKPAAKVPAKSPAKPVRRMRLPARPSGVGLREAAAALRATTAWIVGHCIHRPAETAGTLVAIGAAVYVSINALGFQDGRHPAPILPEPRAQLAAADAIAAKPPMRRISTDLPKVQAEPETAAKEALRAASHEALGPQTRNPGDTTASVTPKPDAGVAKAQRALTKLGYGPLKDDGVMGPGTKAAIEKFERERKLPVKGEAAGRTLKELAARAAAKG